MSLADKLVSRRSTPSLDDLVTVLPTRSTKVVLQKRGIPLRSDQLREVRRVALDLALDDYDFSQAEAIRAGLDLFLSLDLVERIELLEDLRERERALGVGLGSTRTGR